jgi:hypothetical protein
MGVYKEADWNILGDYPICKWGLVKIYGFLGDEHQAIAPIAIWR